MKENTIDDILNENNWLPECESSYVDLEIPMEIYKFWKAQMEWIERSRKISRIICELSDWVRIVQNKDMIISLLRSVLFNLDLAINGDASAIYLLEEEKNNLAKK